MMVVVTVQCVYKALQASLDDFKKEKTASSSRQPPHLLSFLPVAEVLR